MTSYGYDPVLLMVLQRRLRAASAELAAVRSDDPLAVAAVRTARDLRRSIDDGWLPAIDRVVQGDPLGGSSMTFADMAVWQHVARVVRDVGGDAVASMRALFATDARADPFDAAWVAHLDDVAARHLELTQLLVDDPENAAARTELAAIDEQMAGLMAAYASAARAEPTDGHVRWFPTAVLEVAPRTAALALAHLADLGPDVLDDRTLAAISALVLARWRAGGDHGERWPDAFAGGDNTADVLFRTLAMRPAAAREFLRRVSPDALLLSAQFDETVARLVMVGTSPANVDEVAAGEVLRPLLEWLQVHELPATGDGLTRSAPAIAAAAVTPWLAALGPRADRWGWSYDEGDRALRWLLADDAGRVAMTDAMVAQQDRLAVAPLLRDDGRVDAVALSDLATTLGQVQVALRDLEADDGATAGLVARLAFGTAGVVVSALAPAGPVGIAADVGLAVLTPAAIHALDRWGIVASDERRRDRAQHTFGDRAVDTAVIAVTGIVGAAVERGDLPPDVFDRLDLTGLVVRGDQTGERSPHTSSCDPREAAARLHAFILELEPLTDPATFNALVAVEMAFASPGSVAQLCA